MRKKIVTNNFQRLSLGRNVHRFSAVSKVSPNFSARHSSSVHLSSYSHLFLGNNLRQIRLWLMQLSFLRDRLHTRVDCNRSSLRKPEIGFELLLSLLSIHRKSSYMVHTEKKMLNLKKYIYILIKISEIYCTFNYSNVFVSFFK